MSITLGPDQVLIPNAKEINRRDFFEQVFLGGASLRLAVASGHGAALAGENFDRYRALAGLKDRDAFVALPGTTVLPGPYGNPIAYPAFSNGARCHELNPALVVHDPNALPLVGNETVANRLKALRIFKLFVNGGLGNSHVFDLTEPDEHPIEVEVLSNGQVTVTNGRRGIITRADGIFIHHLHHPDKNRFDRDAVIAYARVGVPSQVIGTSELGSFILPNLSDHCRYANVHSPRPYRNDKDQEPFTRFLENNGTVWRYVNDDAGFSARARKLPQGISATPSDAELRALWDTLEQDVFYRVNASDGRLIITPEADARNNFPLDRLGESFKGMKCAGFVLHYFKDGRLQTARASLTNFARWNQDVVLADDGFLSVVKANPAGDAVNGAPPPGRYRVTHTETKHGTDPANCDLHAIMDGPELGRMIEHIPASPVIITPSSTDLMECFARGRVALSLLK